MKLIDPFVVPLFEKDPLKKIEIVGRTCYKSADKITDTSSETFFKNLVSRKHFAMVEHATFVYEVTRLGIPYEELKAYIKETGYLKITNVNNRILISGNLRAINDSRLNILLIPLADYNYKLCYNKISIDVPQVWTELTFLEKYTDLQPEEVEQHFYMTFRFICDRGVSHEIVRHRPASFGQESTRYCNYSLDKFGKEITIVKPSGWNEKSDRVKSSYIHSWETAEREYFNLLDLGETPQQARGVLPTELKTEVNITANAEEWNHIFALRSEGVTGAPHPDMKLLADQAFSMYKREIDKLLKA